MMNLGKSKSSGNGGVARWLVDVDGDSDILCGWENRKRQAV